MGNLKLMLVAAATAFASLHDPVGHGHVLARMLDRALQMKAPLVALEVVADRPAGDNRAENEFIWGD